MRAPDAIEPVVGWRGWGFEFDRLTSPMFHTYWEPMEQLEAGCSLHMHPSHYDLAVPVKGCACGIYIATNIRAAPLGLPVYGKVAGWGRVIPATRGWRVQYAYPKELYIADGMPGAAEALAAYGVPVKSLNALKMEPAEPPLPSRDHFPWRLATVTLGFLVLVNNVLAIASGNVWNYLSALVALVALLYVFRLRRLL